MENKKNVVVIALAVVVMCALAGILFFTTSNKESKSFYSKIDSSSIRLTKDEDNVIHVSADESYVKYCVKSTKTTPNKSNICWKELKDDAFSLTGSPDQQYLWLLDSSNNMTQTISVSNYLSENSSTSQEYLAKFNYNMFETANYEGNGLTIRYNPTLQIIQLNGTMETKSVALGRTYGVQLAAGKTYKLVLNYVGGSYTSTNNPKLVFDFQKNDKNYSPRTYEKTYTNGVLPKSGTVERIINVTSDVLDTTNFYYWLYQGAENATTFDNYRVQVFIMPNESKKVTYEDKYGVLPAITKQGYEFLGWYDSLSGNNKITKDSVVKKRYNHTLYAHWKKLDSDIFADYGTGKWKHYGDTTLKKYATGNALLAFAEYVPSKVVSSGKSVPLIIWLHGHGEIGLSNSKFENAGLPKVIKEWSTTGLRNIPAVVIAPKLKKGMTAWSGNATIDTINAIVKYAKAKYNINENKVILMGINIGGSRVERLHNSIKNLFSSLVIIDGGYDSPLNADISYYKEMPVKGYGLIPIASNSTISPKTNMVKFFNAINHSDDLTQYTAIKDLQTRSFTDDKNGDGISDLIYWAISQKNDNSGFIKSNAIINGEFVYPHEPFANHKNVDLRNVKVDDSLYVDFQFNNAEEGFTDLSFDVVADTKNIDIENIEFENASDYKITDSMENSGGKHVELTLSGPAAGSSLGSIIVKVKTAAPSSVGVKITNITANSEKYKLADATIYEYTRSDATISGEFTYPHDPYANHVKTSLSDVKVGDLIYADFQFYDAEVGFTHLSFDVTSDISVIAVQDARLINVSDYKITNSINNPNGKHVELTLNGPATVSSLGSIILKANINQPESITLYFTDIIAKATNGQKYRIANSKIVG